MDQSLHCMLVSEIEFGCFTMFFCMFSSILGGSILMGYKDDFKLVFCLSVIF